MTDAENAHAVPEGLVALLGGDTTGPGVPAGAAARPDIVIMGEMDEVGVKERGMGAKVVLIAPKV